MGDWQISDGKEIFLASDERTSKVFLNQIRESLETKFEFEYLDVLRPDWITFFW